MSILGKPTTKQMYSAILNATQKYAEDNSTCVKVKVGSRILPTEIYRDYLVEGCNHGVHNCKENGCRRIELYGEASKNHRLPSDCDSIHSEIDAICRAASKGMNLYGATIYVTRYPCEACARAIASAGIKRVIYGRKESISDYTRQILEDKNIEIIHADYWDWEDNNE